MVEKPREPGPTGKSEETLFQQAISFKDQGRYDLAAVFFLAASQDPRTSESEEWAARHNATLFGERVGTQLWGVSMADFMCDQRHSLVCAAIEEACAGGKKVLLLGSALGAYALAAKRGGASYVMCQESNELSKYLVDIVQRENEWPDESFHVTVRPAAQANPEARYDVVVFAERCWGSSLSSKDFEDIATGLQLRAASVRVIPESVSVWVQAYESDVLLSSNWLDIENFQEESGLNYTPYNAAARRSRMAFHLTAAQYGRPISEACECVLVNAMELCSFRPPLGFKALLPMKGHEEFSEAASRLDGILTWTSVSLGGESGSLSWEPGMSEATCWHYCHYLREHCAVREGEQLQISFELQEDGIWQTGPKMQGDIMRADGELSAYHTSMLSMDPQRTRAYRRGIEQAVRSLKARGDSEGSEVNVLDIGAGTGLLSFFAASAGAEVVACERAATTAALASEIANVNESTLAPGSVQVIRAKSTDLYKRRFSPESPTDQLSLNDSSGTDACEDLWKAGNNPPTPHLIVSEIFGSDPLSETVLPVLKSMSECLGPVGPSVAYLPCRCRVWGALARVPVAWEARTEDACNCGISVGELLCPFESGHLLVDLRNEFCDIELLTGPAVIVTHALVPPIRVSGQSSATLPLLPEPQLLYKMMSLPPPAHDCRPSLSNQLCIVMWFDADCTTEPSDDESMRVSTSPTGVFSGHWTQFAQILASDEVGQGVHEAVASGSGAVSIQTAWKMDRTEYSVEVAEPDL